MRITAVIGKNFGDEGKGLVTASLSQQGNQTLIIKHNGGAQAGHTVENPEKGSRFIHHQIGSGAEYGAHTLFADSYHPDLYQIGKEISEFKAIFGFVPLIFSEANANITLIDDVLINMAIETQRGSSRHGSCGMGINECCERIQSGYGLTLGEVNNYDMAMFSSKLKKIRKEYSSRRMEDLGIDSTNPYYELLQDENVLINFAKSALENLSYIRLVDADECWLKTYDNIIFETGQGLLLDEDYTAYAPYLTSSKTGIKEAIHFLTKRKLQLDEAIYVTRTYVTRHGAGPLPNECKREKLGSVTRDHTNIQNEWQGKIRYARHGSIEDFIKPVLDDIAVAGIQPSLAITHLDETAGRICTCEDTTKNLQVEDWIPELSASFQKIYGSWNHKDVMILWEKK